jgi:GNAT superfamily N-acetyltransferase
MMSCATITLRPTRDEDAAFLRALFVEARAADLMADSLPDEQAATLLALQVEARDRDHARRYPHAVDRVIEVDGRPVGRILVDETGAAVRVVDLGVLAAERGRGAATYALTRWTEEADRSGRDMTLQVAFGNPAARIYERIGFEPEPGDDRTQQAMRRSPRREAEHG